VHKSYIVPVDRINGIEGNKLLLKNLVVDLVIGESYKGVLIDIIKDKMIDCCAPSPTQPQAAGSCPKGLKTARAGTLPGTQYLLC
jgi:hypothetical protein